MYVPNYIPQPLEVPGNVSQASTWRGKLRFLRQVTALHLASVALLVGIVLSPLPAIQVVPALETLFAILFALCVARILTRGTQWDQRVALMLLPLALVAVASVAAALQHNGFPTWSPLAGLGAATLYTFLCGRDFSFVGQYMLSLIVSEVLLATLAQVLHQNPRQAAWSMGSNAVYLTFYCYDMASLMSRRRANETLAAVVDLYRDVLNVFGWTVRCLKHWRRHRIFVAPWN